VRSPAWSRGDRSSRGYRCIGNRLRIGNRLTCTVTAVTDTRGVWGWEVAIPSAGQPVRSGALVTLHNRAVASPGRKQPPETEQTVRSILTEDAPVPNTCRPSTLTAAFPRSAPCFTRTGNPTPRRPAGHLRPRCHGGSAHHRHPHHPQQPRRIPLGRPGGQTPRRPTSGGRTRPLQRQTQTLQGPGRVGEGLPNHRSSRASRRLGPLPPTPLRYR
jgi:hypothetical protein